MSHPDMDEHLASIRSSRALPREKPWEGVCVAPSGGRSNAGTDLVTFGSIMLPCAMTDSTPTHSLSDLKKKVEIAHYAVTRAAAEGAGAMGMDEVDIKECIQTHSGKAVVVSFKRDQSRPPGEDES